MIANDIRGSVLEKAGRWTEAGELDRCARPDRLNLRWAGDRVLLKGPLRVRVVRCLEQETAGSEYEIKPLSSYLVTVPDGSTWSYELSQAEIDGANVSSGASYGIYLEDLRQSMEAAQATTDHSMVQVYQAAPQYADVRTHAHPDLPCDFAVANIPNLARFFPSACEPCPPGASIGLPPRCGPTLAIPAAPGGCVRPRFFNGMFITQEDLEALLRWTRLKNQLQNRASGSGVVWGLDVKRDGRRILVQPGYGVDCCGRDLTINTPYCVDIDTLLCDPAAAPVLSQPGPQCLHLLLEYYECPEDPRPVHGDACSPEVSHCEMSRIRETARLRLVPPRKYEASGPIQVFLDEVTKIGGKAATVLAGRYEAAADPATHPAPLPDVPELTPYRFEIVSPPGFAADRIDLQPKHAEDVPETKLFFPGDDRRVEVRLKAASDYDFQQGTFNRITEEGKTELGTVAAGSTEAVWTLSLADFLELSDNLAVGSFEIENLRAENDDGFQLESSPQLQLSVYVPGGQGPDWLVGATVPAVQMTWIRPTRPSRVRWDCFSDPCCPEKGPLFPGLPPFAHGDLTDLKVWTLAVVHVWITAQLGRTGGQGSDALAAGAAKIYAMAAQVLFEVSDTDAQRLAAAMHRLLCEWCNGFLYPGPRCAEKPDGVVIGCVRAEGGNITALDPWGGRRYVVHYPLLAHWGEQIGIVPLDVTVSRFMSMICCVARQPLPWRAAEVDSGRDWNVVPIGASYLHARDLSAAAPPELARMEISRTEEIASANDFLRRAADGLLAAPPPAGTPYVRVRLSGAPGVELLTPERGAPAARPPAATADRLDRRIRDLGATSRISIPPLMEGFSRELTGELLRNTPLKRLAESPQRDRLVDAGLFSVGRFFDRSLSEVHEVDLERADPRNVLDLAKANEPVAAGVNRAVRAALKTVAEAGNFVAAEELESPEEVDKLTEAVIAEIKRRRTIPLPEEGVRAALAKVFRQRKKTA